MWLFFIKKIRNSLVSLEQFTNQCIIELGICFEKYSILIQEEKK